MVRRSMNRFWTLSGVVTAALVVGLVFSSTGAEKETETKTENECDLKEPGNWSYKMNDWEWLQPVENQKRWDRETKGWWFNFGPTGVRVKFSTAAPRVAKVMYVYPSSPADKKILKGDEIIGVNGKNFTSDEPFPSDKTFAIKGPRLEVAKAIEESEGNPSLNGVLTFTVKRGPKTFPVEVQLEKLGYFSPTFPYNCKKSRLLAERAGDWLIENRRDGKHMMWGPPRMGSWIDSVGQLALVSFGDRYKKYLEFTSREYESDGGTKWSWIAGINLITFAEKYQLNKDKKYLAPLGTRALGSTSKAGPSGAYSHETWYEGAAFQLAFAAGLNGLGLALAEKCGAQIDTNSYLRTRYLLTCKTNEKGNIGYGAANKTPYSAEDARKAVGNINPSIVGTDELAEWRLVGGAACTTLMHFIDPRDSFSEAFVKRGVRHAVSARWTARQSHACGSLTFVYNTLAASIAPLVGEEEMYRKYMDDMKWWLNITRCHNGGWYFEPKIDTEANEYERIHMTAAAILMLNAPLRELYVNGKGRTDPGVRRSAVTRSDPATPVEPVKPARNARTLTPERRKVLDSALKAALVKMSESNELKPVPIAISLTRARVWLKEMGGDGNLTFQVAGGTQTASFKWDDLSAADYATLSLLLANLKADSSDAQAMAGVYMESIGKMDEADNYYKKAGETSAGKLQKLFD